MTIVATAFPLIHPLSTNGDGTGTVSQNGNFTPGTPGFFFIQPAAGTTIGLATIVISISDDAIFNQGDYGAIANGLANGIAAESRLAGIVRDPLEGFRIKKNYQWLPLGTIVLTSFAGVSQTLVITIDFQERYDCPLILNGRSGAGDGDYFGMRVTDNLTTLVDQIAFANGYIG